MELRNLNPYVRFARVQKKSIPNLPIVALDHRFLWCLSGKGSIRIGEEEYHLKEGALIFFRAGLTYHAVAEGPPPVLLGCNFDMFYRKENESPPISYVQAGDYSPDMLIEPELPPADDEFPDVIFLPYAPFKDALEEIISVYDNPSCCSDELCGALLKCLLIKMVKLYVTGNSSKTGRVNEVIEYVKEHYNENMTNLILAKKFSYHPNYISHLVKEHTGMTLHHYLLDYRVKKAVLLLKSGEYNVTDVALEVGFSDVKHFSKCFRKYIGSPPSTFLPKTNDMV